MCYFMPNLQTPPNILKEGEGGVMGMNRGEKGEKFWWNWREREDKNCSYTIKNSRLKT